MPELRRDPVVGYWTIISTERSRRPIEYRPPLAMEERWCPFCEGREKETGVEIDSIRRPGSDPNSPGWDVRVILSKRPLLANASAAIERFGAGVYDLMDGIGQHELIIESPRHEHDLDEMSVETIEKVIQVYIRRIHHMGSDPRFKYALLFKNHGLISGSAKDLIRHSRSQIIGLPITPKRVKEELLSTRKYYERRDRCVFCDIMRQEKQTALRIVAENEHFFAFCPYASRTPFETWILPKKHSADFAHLPPAHFKDFARMLKECLSKIRNLLDDPPYNFILHTAPFRHRKREVYWKTIEEDYHWYLQISPRLTKNAGFEWGTGIHINPTPPEEAALLLRQTVVDVE